MLNRRIAQFRMALILARHPVWRRGLKLGIGAMTQERMKSFFDKMVKAGVVKGNIDYRLAYDLRFINKGVGLDLRPKN